MIRKLAAIFTVLFLALGIPDSEASSIKFVNSIPANGSEIMTFDIKLQFDISDNIAEQGTDNIGVGYIGSYDASDPERNYATLLYEGTPENGRLIAVTLDTNFKGISQSKDIIDLNFSSGLVPEAGKTYTVVCNNSFPLYDLTTGKSIKGGTLNWQTDPKVFTFIGAIPSSSELIFQKSSVIENSSLPQLNSISYDFNEDISFIGGQSVQILNGVDLVASSKTIKIDPANAKSLLVNFDEVSLYLGKQYTINLPEGIVCLKSNSTVVNKPVEITVNGSSTISLSTKSVSPKNNSTSLPESADIRFNLEPGQTLTPPQSNIIYKRDIDFYQGEISESNFISTLRGTANDDGITWDLSEFRFEPETKYILHKKADDITVWVDGKAQPAYGNEEVIVSFTTPSIAEAGFPPMEFANPKMMNGDGSLATTDYSPDMKIPRISLFFLELKDQYYPMGSESYEIVAHPNSQDIKLYEISDNGDRLIKSLSFDYTNVEDKYRIWKAVKVPVSTILYEGKKYKLVFPAEMFTVSPPVKEHGDMSNISKCNYIKNDELVYTFTGTTSAECVLLDCNIADNSTVSSLYNVVWTFEGDYHLSDDITTVTYQASLSSGQSVGAVKRSVKLTNTLGGANTAVMVDFVDSSTGNPTTINKGTKSTITVPKGLLVNSSNEDIVNDEIVLTIIGGAEDPSELVSVNFTVEGVHSSSHDAVKGREYNFTLSPAENWEVESVSTGGRELSPVVFDNTTNTYFYQLSTLRGDTDVNARYRYVGEWAQSNEAAGVWTISDSNIRIYKDADYIVVEGVDSANTINVYTVGGMLVNSTRVPADKDCVRITVSPGQYYIVTVDGVAAKLKM